MEEEYKGDMILIDRLSELFQKFHFIHPVRIVHGSLHLAFAVRTGLCRFLERLMADGADILVRAQNVGLLGPCPDPDLLLFKTKHLKHLPLLGYLGYPRGCAINIPRSLSNNKDSKL